MLIGNLLLALLDKPFQIFTLLWRVNDSDQTLPKSAAEEVEGEILKAGGVYRILGRKLESLFRHTALAGPWA